MIKPEVPQNEEERIRALEDLSILDTGPEPQFDRIIRLGQRLFTAPIVLISLVDRNRQWFKSGCGLSVMETPRDISFCGHAILDREILCIPDTSADRRFHDNPLVTGDPYVRFYAGAPLHTKAGYRIGTLCIIDHKTRTFNHEDQLALRSLADCVESELELRGRAGKDKRRLEHMIGVSPGVFYIRHVSDLSTTYVSPQVEQILGYKSTQLIEDPKFWVDHIHPQDRQRVVGDMSMLFDLNEYSLEYRFLHADGNYRWMHDNLRLIRDIHGIPEQITGVCMDMSRQKNIESNLRLSESRLRAVIDNLAEGIITIDSKGIVQNANPAVSRIFGYKDDELVGANIRMLMTETVSRAHPNFLRNYLQTGRKKVIDKTVEVEGRHKNGSTLHLELTVSELKVNGELMFSGIVRDISSRRRLELDTNRYVAIVQSTDDAIISKTLDGFITSWNPGAEKMFGYTADEALGKSVTMLFTDDRLDEEHDILQRLRNSEKVAPFETIRRRKDGSLVNISVTISPIRDRLGNIIGVSKIARDITERKKIERLKNEFVSTVSHELRTPLTSIRGALSLVLGGAGGEIPLKSQGLLQMAERNAERLTMLVNDILDLEKIVSGEIDFDFGIVNLVSLSLKAIAENQTLAYRHHVTLAMDSALKQAPVFGDERRLMQVFANLISNAVKFSPKNATVTISVVSNRHYFRVRVVDEGRGIPEEFRDRIFQRFAQADSSDTREKGGTGLGLAISKAIVERHEGVIGYRTKQDAGTEFYFDLPQHHVELPEKKSRVLICENDGDLADILANMVESTFISCDVASDAQTAMSMLDANDYHLLMLDLKLPDADGITLLHGLRTTRETAKLPVIVIAGHPPDPGYVQFGEFSDWIQKPLDHDRVVRAVRVSLGLDRLRILHVEDDPDLVQVFTVLLEDTADIFYAGNLEDALSQLARHRFDLVVMELTIKGESTLAVLDAAEGKSPVIVFSAQPASRDIIQRVSLALMKSTTGNDELLKAVNNILGKGDITRQAMEPQNTTIA